MREREAGDDRSIWGGGGGKMGGNDERMRAGRL